MRTFVLAALSCLFMLSVKAQIVNIPDANFKNALLSHSPVINTNNDGEIQVSEALAFTGTINVPSKNIADLTGINSFTNITGLRCQVNQIITLSLNGFNALTTIDCSSNLLTSLTLNSLAELRTIGCSSNRLTTLQLSNLPKLQGVGCSYNYLTSVNFSGFPLLKGISISMNSTLTDLVLDNLPSLTSLSCYGGKISNLTLSGLPLLDTLDCGNNKLTSLTIPNPAALKILNAPSNLLTSLQAGLTGLRYLDVSRNQISNFALDNMNLLQFAYVSHNLCSSFSLTNKPVLKFIRCDNNLISNLQLSNLPLLTTLDCRNNLLPSFTLSGYNLLEEIRLDNNQLTSLTLGNLPSLKYLTCDDNKLPALILSNYPLFSNLNCSGNQMTNLSLNNVPNLYSLYCNNNLLTSLPFLTPGSFPALRFLDITGNRITRLVLENLASLGVLSCSDNPIDSLRLKNLPALNSMRIEKNKLTSLTLDTLPNLRVLYCGKSDSLRNISLNLPRVSNFFCDSSNLVSLDISKTEAQEVQVTNNPLLQYINMKNNVGSLYNTIKFSRNNMLQFICVDSAEKARVTDSVLSQLPGQGVIVSTVCNFTPAINSIVKGTVRFDQNANGCNNTDSAMVHVRLNNNDGIYSTTAFTNNSGQYIFYTPANIDTVAIAPDQPAWFNVSPGTQQIINIPNQGITVIADFCVSANGVHPDLEVVLLPITPARPGFTAKYRVVFSNKGNQVQSGSVSLGFNSAKLNFISSIPTATNQTAGNLVWSFGVLSPGETRIIDLVFRVNAPPIVNIGDILSFTALIEPRPGDETADDNNFNLRQVVTGAFDPNDKLVTEGAEIDISKIGEYLHYIIRFQNTGNAEAINVIIKDSLAANVDWNSIVPVNASHAFRTLISKGNKVEFIFENINLPGMATNEPASHGFVSFKIKPRSTVTVGETISNKAEIYFDYNLPVITNTVTTTIVTPSQPDNEIDLKVYANPVRDEIRFTVKPGSTIKAINLYNAVGERLYREVVSGPGTDRSIQAAHLPTGILFLEVITTEGKAVQKITRIR